MGRSFSIVRSAVMHSGVGEPATSVKCLLILGMQDLLPQDSAT